MKLSIACPYLNLIKMFVIALRVCLCAHVGDAELAEQ